MALQTHAQRMTARRQQPIPATVQDLAERSSPIEIRLDIQKLLQQEQMELAQALGDAGLSLYPGNEDMLGINALLAMSRSAWDEAVDLLQQLKDVQGEQSPATTDWLLARCLRCQGHHEQAITTLENGLRRHPASAELQSELGLMVQAAA